MEKGWKRSVYENTSILHHLRYLSLATVMARIFCLVNNTDSALMISLVKLRFCHMCICDASAVMSLKAP